MTYTSEDVLWQHTPFPGILDFFGVDAFTTFVSIIGILSFLGNILIVAIRLYRSKKKKSVSQNVRNRETVAIVVLIVVFLVSSTITSFQMRHINGTREIHYTLTSQAFRIALDDRTLTALINAEGGGVVTSQITIRAASPKQPVDKFELHYRLPDYPGGGAGKKMDSMNKRSKKIKCDNNHELLLNAAPGAKANSYRVVAHISPPLDPSSSTCMLDPLETKVPNSAIAMTRSEAQRRKPGDPREYFSFEVLYPCNKLTLIISFPPGFEIRGAGFHAWHGEARVPHLGEEEYMRRHYEEVFQQHNNRVTKRTDVTLSIEYPLLGIHYGIGWLPPENWP